MSTAIHSVQLFDVKYQVSVLCTIMILYLNIYIYSKHKNITLFSPSLLTWWYQLGIPAKQREKTKHYLREEAYYSQREIKHEIVCPMHTIHLFLIRIFIFKVFRECHFCILAIIFLHVKLFLIMLRHMLGHMLRHVT